MPGMAIRCAAWRTISPASAWSNSSWTDSSLPGMSSLMCLPGAVYSGGTPR